MNNAGPKQEAAAARDDMPGIPLVIRPGAMTGIIAAIPKMIGERMPKVNKIVGIPDNFSIYAASLSLRSSC